MWAMLVNILNFGFTIAAVIIANYVMLLGLRDIIYFIAPGPGGRKPFNLEPGKAGVFGIARRIIFWVAFVSVSALFMYLIIPFTLFVIAGRLIFTAGKSFRIRPPAMSFFSALLMLVITFAHVRSQPVIQQFGEQFSADMWLYNAGNSLLEKMMRAAMGLNVSTAGIEYLAGMIPSIQRNMLGFLVLSIYVFSSVLTGSLSGIFTKGRGIEMPPYYCVPPVKIFPVIALAILAAGRFVNIGPMYFVLGGIYYALGVNLLIYAMRGGRWYANLILLVAGAMHPVSITIFIVLGALDNFLDLRRLGALLGLRPRFD